MGCDWGCETFRVKLGRNIVSFDLYYYLNFALFVKIYIAKNIRASVVLLAIIWGYANIISFF